MQQRKNLTKEKFLAAAKRNADNVIDLVRLVLDYPSYLPLNRYQRQRFSCYANDQDNQANGTYVVSALKVHFKRMGIQVLGNNGHTGERIRTKPGRNKRIADAHVKNTKRTSWQSRELGRNK